MSNGALRWVPALVLVGALTAPLAAGAQAGTGLAALGPQRGVITAQSATPAPPPAPAPRAPTARTSRSWMPVLGNLAAGGLLGSLLGGNVLFGILMVVLLVAIGAYVARLILRVRSESLPAAQFVGLGSETVAAPPPSQAAGINENAAVASGAGRGPQLPEGFDLAGFLRVAKLNFVRLQVANDVGRLDEVREFATPELYAALAKGAFKRAGRPPHTDVVSLNAEIVQVVTEGDMHRASIRFSGMARAAPGTAPEGFAEIWHLARPAEGSTGWLLARIQQAD